MFYIAMAAETLWIYKATIKFQDFFRSAEILIGRIIKMGSDNLHEKGFIETNSHEDCFIKYWKTDVYFKWTIIQF